MSDQDPPESSQDRIPFQNGDGVLGKIGEGQEVVPVPIAFEDTGKFPRALCSAVQGGNTVTPDGDGGGGNSDAPDRHAESIKKHNLITILLTLLLGPGGAIAVVYATSDRAKANSYEVKHLKTLEPRVDNAEKEIHIIKADVSGINQSMKEVKASSKAIAVGIEELKQENVNRLKSELEDAKREIRRHRLNRDR